MALRSLRVNSKPRPLQFVVGPHTYSVVLSPFPIFQHDREMMALWSEHSREVVISPACPPASRVAVIAKMIGYAFVEHTGEPSQVEDWCDLMGTVATSAVKAFEAAGGIKAIEQLPSNPPAPIPAEVHARIIGEVLERAKKAETRVSELEDNVRKLREALHGTGSKGARGSTRAGSRRQRPPTPLPITNVA